MLDRNVANQTDPRDHGIDLAVVRLEMYMRLEKITPGCDGGWFWCELIESEHGANTGYLGFIARGGEPLDQPALRLCTPIPCWER